MALSPAEWAALAATISAMADVYTIGRDTFASYYQKRISTKENFQKANILAKAFSTYSDDEVDAIQARIANCRKKFIDEGSGQARRKCICSVLSDVKDGNGGNIPDPEWSSVYDALKCGS